MTNVSDENMSGGKNYNKIQILTWRISSVLKDTIILAEVRYRDFQEFLSQQSPWKSNYFGLV